MILPYFLRLSCLCFASFFVLNLAAGLLVRFFSKSAIRFAELRAPRAAARLLLGLRLLPFALAALFVVALCVPSYLWLEPPAVSERVGFLSIFLGILVAATWLISIARAIHSLMASWRHNRLCRLAGSNTSIPGESSSLLVVESHAPLLAMSGLLRPRLLISRGVLQTLSSEELSAALLHEHAHRTSRDNAKRLLLLLAPDIFPFFRPLRALEHSWSRLAEWAADDEATAGDSNSAVSLAAALIQVARMGSAPRMPYLSTSLLACDRDLSARVDRLLYPVAPARRVSKPAQHRLRIAAFVLAGFLMTLLLAPSALSSVHQLLELLLH
jgi:beta-lactamase regulating signal transducer with metallopeptidase domain